MVHSFSLLRAILFIVLSAQQMSKITDSRNILKQRILSKHTDDWCLLFSQWSYHLCDLSSLQWHFCPWGFLSSFAELCALYLKFCKQLWGRIFPWQDCFHQCHRQQSSRVFSVTANVTSIPMVELVLCYSLYQSSGPHVRLWSPQLSESPQFHLWISSFLSKGSQADFTDKGNTGEDFSSEMGFPQKSFWP